MIAYEYYDSHPTHGSDYLWPALKEVIRGRTWSEHRAFDLGCGNGATCNMLASLGFEAHGVDVSETGIAIAQKAFPNIKVSVGSAYDDLASRLGSFPLVVSLEVIAHCTNPRAFAKTFLDLIAPGGVGFLSTPYHGYLKNLALALSGRMDAHFSTLWPGGPVKFFSADTLCQLLATEGATQLQLLRVGRIPPLAKAMIAIVRKAEV